MADPGSVAYMFNRRGVVIVKKVQGDKNLKEDDLLESVLDAGAQEINNLGDNFEILMEPSDIYKVRSALEASGIECESAEVSFLPSVSISVEGETAKAVFELIDAIEDLDDVQNVYGNFDVSEEVMASLA
jgi:transcriptional/translational regulatory protein YebC/TACO1